MFDKLFTLEPIIEYTWWKLFILYWQYFAFGLAVVLVVNHFFGKKRKVVNIPWSLLLISVSLENFMFRWVPAVFGPLGLKVGHLLWGLAHGNIVTLTWTLTHGLLLLRLCLGGNWWAAFVVHLLHDVWLVGILKFAIYLKPDILEQ